jgi:hypothetical protein
MFKGRFGEEPKTVEERTRAQQFRYLVREFIDNGLDEFLGK